MPRSASPTDTLHAAAGPETLQRLKAAHLVPGVHHFYREPPQIVAGRGCTLVDHRGRTYLDCYSGVTVMSAGHANPAIIEPAIDQIRTLQHTTTIYLTEPVLRLAERLARVMPGRLCRSFFCASGSEAVEGALLLAAQRTRRGEIVAFTNALHGRTRWTMSATGLDLWRTDPFPVSGVHRARFGDADDLARVLDEHGSRVAAVIGEPIQGNGGINEPGDDFWPRVRALCDEHGALLVLDEVQTGLNRTGRLLACEHWSVVPDVVALSKALGNGFPIAAFVATDDVAAEGARPGASTYGGNPVSAAAALATLDFHERHDLGRCARERGEQLRRGLQDLRRDGEPGPRGRGLMLGVPIVDAAGAPSGPRCDAILEELLDRGILAGKTGPDRNVLTFMPPLVIDEDEVAIVLGALAAALAAAE